MTTMPAASAASCLDPSTIRVRQRAAAVVRRADGQVLLHRRKGDVFWALPGGAIEPGESASEALARELHEELGTAVAVGALAFVVENFFHHAGEACHELGLYLHATPLPGSLLARCDGPYDGVEGVQGGEHGEGDKALVFAWFSVQALAALDVRPGFLRSALAQPPGSAGALHIVHRDPQPSPSAPPLADTPPSFS